MRAFRLWSIAALALVVGACERSGDRITGAPRVSAAVSGNQNIGINVVLRARPTAAQLAELGTYGKVRGTLPEINGVLMLAKGDQLAAIQALSYVAAAGPDQERTLGPPVDAVAVTDFAGGRSTWDQDWINVTDVPGATGGRTIDRDGSGVWVGVLDTGLLDSWRQYFPQERIAEQFGIAFNGGGALDAGTVASQPNQWEHDQNSHGTHVTSTILGFQFGSLQINGTAPKATIIPVKVLNQAGFGFSSMVAQGILYVTDLKRRGLLGPNPRVVLNMSLGGSRLDPLEQAAINFAIDNRIIIVAAAGNAGTAGMHFPGAYAPVISAAASGWLGEWRTCTGSTNFRNWWRLCNVADPTSEVDAYIATFSSRAIGTQDLDVAAPGSWVVGPFQLQSGKTSFFFLSGTSMATPHVAGIVALMLQKNPAVAAADANRITDAEKFLEGSAILLPQGCRNITQPNLTIREICWGTDATGHGLATADAALAATPSP